MVLTWAALHTRRPEVVLSTWVGHQLVEVGVVANEARAGVFTQPVILEVPTGLKQTQQSPGRERDTILNPHAELCLQHCDRFLSHQAVGGSGSRAAGGAVLVAAVAR